MRLKEGGSSHLLNAFFSIGYEKYKTAMIKCRYALAKREGINVKYIYQIERDGLNGIPIYKTRRRRVCISI